MHIQNNVSLKDFSTMRLGGLAHALTTVTNVDELREAVAWADEQKLPILVLGGGSNVIFSDGYAGLVIVNAIPGFEVLGETTVRIGAGENWDNAVKHAVDLGLHGIEYLSAIPGTAGATPVQNVGAYGAQISDVFKELQAFDLQTHQLVTLTKTDCGFTYRHSIFKSPKNRRYIITSITLELNKKSPTPPFYASLQRYLDEHNITNYTPQAIRDAVVAIRAIKLPDPSKIANTGSFFKNPIVPAKHAAELLAKHPTMPHWDAPDNCKKLAAGWLIEQAGLKSYHAHGMATYEHHALVLVNESAKNYADLAAFRQEITDTVHKRFGVTLEQEPELL
ncbi:MAG TPA: UDP-N-acetylmuramate dehydrogenase [Candidatus Saccharimonas sp.]|nr:UDP-N-acetylmuramate dehydrogenase [Candidatus Saccharimonas sp.]